MTDSVEKTRERFIEQMGLVAQGEGMPRIAGRLMGMMVFDGRAYSFGELATALQVSRGSVSTNARLLENMGVIERVTKPGDRQDYFELTADPYAAIIAGARTRSAKARDIIARNIAALPARGQSGTKRRLKDYEHFYGAIVEALDEVERCRG